MGAFVVWKKYKGFTLAEVLITLGIIGTVASITIPLITTKYQKSVVETRIKKFYTVFNQALRLSVSKNGDISSWTFPADYYDWHGSGDFFNTYLSPYMKYTKIKEHHSTVWPTSGVLVYLSDGSAFNISDTWVTFYPVSKAIDRDNNYNPTRDIFLFEIAGNYNMLLPSGYNYDDDTLKAAPFSGCDKNFRKDRIRYCAEIIRRNGWKIPDDYPW